MRKFLKKFDPSAIASDVPRSFKQFLMRGLAKTMVKFLGLNRPGIFSTEIVQSIQPVAVIPTMHGDLLCHAGHGRLVWRAKTFHSEEPQTIEWLDTLGPNDVLYDIGANVGLYSIYAAKFRRCTAFAFEPEAQNYAILLQNIALNDVIGKCLPSCAPVSNRSGFGFLHVPYITKGGAYNQFDSGRRELSPDKNNFSSYDQRSNSLEQLVYGFSLDDLIMKHGFDIPTHVKIDVDGIEPLVVDGAMGLFDNNRVRTVLIEINRQIPEHFRICDILSRKGFRVVAERSNWLSRKDRRREAEMPTVNIIFARGKDGTSSMFTSEHLQC